MSDLARALAEARQSLRVDWSPERARTVQGRIVRAQRAQKIRRGGITVLAAGVVALVAVNVIQHRVAADPLAVHWADGIDARRSTPDTQLTLVSATPDRTVVRLDRGAARFQVAHRASRVFQVQAGDVVVEDRGTMFTVEREPSGTLVAVSEGQVEIRWPGGSQSLWAGEQGSFPPAEEDGAESAAESPDKAPGAKTPSHPHHHRTNVPTSWKSLAEDGDYDAAYEALHGAGRTTVRDETGELLLSVDVARLSHHPSEAVAPLKRILSNHPMDPRAPLAAFTLGRVLLEDLGSPREAAGAFAEVGHLDPDGALVEDALAREVESWSRAGELHKAHVRAEEYLKRYPDGRRARSVSRFGHIE
jgi:transmembrane sensor